MVHSFPDQGRLSDLGGLSHYKATAAISSSLLHGGTRFVVIRSFPCMEAWQALAKGRTLAMLSWHDSELASPSYNARGEKAPNIHSARTPPGIDEVRIG